MAFSQENDGGIVGLIAAFVILGQSPPVGYAGPLGRNGAFIKSGYSLGVGDPHGRGTPLPQDDGIKVRFCF